MRIYVFLLRAAFLVNGVAGWLVRQKAAQKIINLCSNHDNYHFGREFEQHVINYLSCQKSFSLIELPHQCDGGVEPETLRFDSVLKREFVDMIEVQPSDCTNSNSIVLWAPASMVFPSIDFIITQRDEFFLVSATIRKNHEVVVKCRASGRQFSGFLPTVLTLQRNGFSINPIRFVWAVPTGMKDKWLASRPRPLHRGIQLLSKDERMRLNRMKINQYVCSIPFE